MTIPDDYERIILDTALRVYLPYNEDVVFDNVNRVDIQDGALLIYTDERYVFAYSPDQWVSLEYDTKFGEDEDA